MHLQSHPYEYDPDPPRWNNLNPPHAVDQKALEGWLILLHVITKVVCHFDS